MDSALKIRKHLTPPSGMRAAFHDLRREVRREVSERVSLQCAGQGAGVALEGWTLNVSRGGVRVIVERPVGLGEVFDVTVGTANASPLVRQGRVVWFQEEADGYIVGIAFVAPRSLAQ
jgi:hypothetical protein